MELPLGLADPLDEVFVAAFYKSGLTNWMVRNRWTAPKIQMVSVGFLLTAAYNVHYSHRIRTVAFAGWIILNGMATAVAYQLDQLTTALQFRFLMQVCVGVGFWRLIYAMNPNSWTLWAVGYPAVILSSINTLLQWKYTTSGPSSRNNLSKYLRISRWAGASTWNMAYLFLLASSGIRRYS